MNSSFFIARRYLFSKKTQNVINIISGVSVFGIAVSTAAMVIILSGFNGIEGLVFKMFSSFESDVEITTKNSKTFDRSFIPAEVFQLNGIANYTEVIEEIAIVKNEDNFIIGTIKGVEQPFMKMCDIKEHLLDGEAVAAGRDGAGDVCAHRVAIVVLHGQHQPVALVGQVEDRATWARYGL